MRRYPDAVNYRMHIFCAGFADFAFRVRLLVLEPGSEADGITVELNTKPE